MASVIPTPSKLYEAIDEADVVMRRARELRVEAFREYTGRYYGEDDTVSRPINIVYRAVKVLQAHIAHTYPEYEIETDDPSVRGEAVVLSLVLSRLADELRFVHIDRLALLDAMLGPRAVVRMGMRVGDEVVTQEGRGLNPGQWYIRRISLDNHLVDSAAREQELIAWEGDRYLVSRDRVLESGLFDNAIIESLPTLPSRAPGGQQRLDSLSGRSPRGTRELIDCIELIDVFLYDVGGRGETIKLTLPADRQMESGYLLEDLYQGPERGPYEWLEFDPIPDNLESLPPVSGFREQSVNLNDILTKLLTQISKSKNIAVVGEDTPEDEVDAIREADDGTVLRVRDPRSAKVLNMSITDPGLIPLGQMFMHFANVQAGNPDILSGVKTSSDTATEYAGQATAAQQLLSIMVSAHDQFWTRVGRHALWYLVHDPMIQVGTTKRLPGGAEVRLKYSAEAREGDWADFRLRVRPSSTVRVDPNVKADKVARLIGMVPVLAQAEAMTGGYVDAAACVRVLGRHLGVEEMDECFRDPAMLERAAMKYQAVPPLTPGVPVEVGGPAQTRPMDAIRSAMMAGR